MPNALDSKVPVEPEVIVCTVQVTSECAVVEAVMEPLDGEVYQRDYRSLIRNRSPCRPSASQDEVGVCDVPVVAVMCVVMIAPRCAVLKRSAHGKEMSARSKSVAAVGFNELPCVQMPVLAGVRLGRSNRAASDGGRHRARRAFVTSPVNAGICERQRAMCRWKDCWH